MSSYIYVLISVFETPPGYPTENHWYTEAKQNGAWKHFLELKLLYFDWNFMEVCF